MSASRVIPRDVVARQLGVPSSLLSHYEKRGLVRVVSEGAVQGYEPAELGRVWTVLSLHRDAGINLAGVECVLRLRDQVRFLHHQMLQVAEQLREIADEPWHEDAESES